MTAVARLKAVLMLWLLVRLIKALDRRLAALPGGDLERLRKAAAAIRETT